MSPPIVGARPWIPKEDRDVLMTRIGGILDSGVFTQGPYVADFEKACADMAGVADAVAVSSGGVALELLLEALDIAGSEVIVPTETFVATANAVVRAGGVPVFADIDPATLSVSVSSLEACVTPRTRAVLLVHMFGLMSPEIPAIQAFCAERNLLLLEDAAHAHGASAGPVWAGGIGVAGCFSFYATKILTTGEGGVITTRDPALAERLRCLRDHGRDRTGAFSAAGNNYRLAEIPAAIGLAQLDRLRENLACRRAHAAFYREALCDEAGLTLIDPAPREGHVYWRYALLLNDTPDRGELQTRMARDHGVRITWMYEPLCHQQPVYAARPEGQVTLPGAEAVCGRLINLPTHPNLDRNDVQRVVDGLRATLRTLS